MNHIARVAVALVASVFVLSACEMTDANALKEQTPELVQSAESTLAQLEDAQEIRIKKKAFSFGDEWSISVSDKEVAKVYGMDIPAYGDTYSIVTPDGGFIGGEEEKIFNVAKTAKFFDAEKVETGTLKKKLTFVNAKYELTGTDDQLVATLKQKFGLNFKGSVLDTHNKAAWAYSAKMISAAADITMTRKSGKVSALDAIRMVLVANEVYEAENE